jgi:nitronate monooxygenase
VTVPPVVLAPLAGGPSTPELAAAVASAGGLGFVAAGYLSADELDCRLRRARELTAGPLGVNLFVLADEPVDHAAMERYARELEPEARALGVELGEPRFEDDGWEAKLALLEREAVPVVSFTFGCPPTDVVERLHAAGSDVWVTVTDPDEGREAAAAGADALVAQGFEAGGHRASFTDGEGAEGIGLLSLLRLLRAAADLPLVAAGGIVDGAGVAAVLCAGADAAAVGTALALSPEAGTAPLHREAIAGAGDTRVTRAFTGRSARGIANRVLSEHSAAAPVAYPEIHHATAPLRAAARAAGDAEVVNLWAGQAHSLARALPAGELVRTLGSEARAILRELAAR